MERELRLNLARSAALILNTLRFGAPFLIDRDLHGDRIVIFRTGQLTAGGQGLGRSSANELRRPPSRRICTAATASITAAVTRWTTASVILLGKAKM